MGHCFKCRVTKNHDCCHNFRSEGILTPTKICRSIPHKYCLDYCAVVNIICGLLHLPRRIRLNQPVERVLSLLPCFYHLKYELLWIAIALVASNEAAASYDKLAYVM